MIRVSEKEAMALIKVKARKSSRRPQKVSKLEQSLEAELLRNDLCGYKRQFRWHKHRKWPADFAFEPERILIECDGGSGIRVSRSGKVYTGAHTSREGFRKDAEKKNEAQLCGWTILVFDLKMIKSGAAINTIKRALGKS